ncbi:glycosyltransferase [Staphylococcus simulans]|uniref:glycosyltransferase n=1 Tax=Staphylococcus simulans TaxID=1286 RepID=UPI0022778A5B|nr:glycosyltransferase [Staphylococcus simulans]
MKSFEENAENFQVHDDDLLNKECKNFVYTGSIRQVNYLSLLVEAANIIEKKYPESKVKLLIYGDGDERPELEEKVESLNLSNIIFKGKVHKKYVPYILKNSYANILHNRSTKLDKYGQSQNKLFEYLAAGRPIIQTYQTGYSVIQKENCGICVSKQTPENIAESILKLANNETISKIQGDNSKKVAKNYDFENLTNKLIEIIEK